MWVVGLLVRVLRSCNRVVVAQECLMRKLVWVGSASLLMSKYISAL